MKEENEQGFLSHRFDDWSSEPIPNGWSKIQSELEGDSERNRKTPFWMAFGLAILAGSGLILFNQSDRISAGGMNSSEIAISENGNEDKAITNIQEKQVGSEMKPEVRSVKEAIETHDISQTQNTVTNDKTESLKESKGRLEGGEISQATTSQSSEKVIGSRNGPLLAVSAVKNKFSQSSKIFRAKSENQNAGKSNLKPDTDTPSSAHFDFLDDGGMKNEIVNSIQPGFQQNQPIEGNEKSDLSSNEGMPEEKAVESLEGRTAQLHLPDQKEEPGIFPVKVENVNPTPTIASKWIFSIGLTGGYAPRSIEINQSQAISRLSMSNQNGGSPSLFGNVGFTIQNEIKPWLRSFGAVKVGMMQNAMAVTETSKSPSDFTMTTSDSVNYSMTPVWSSESGTIRQDLIFSTLEFGLNPILIPSRQSGPFASVVVWISLYQNVSSDLGRSVASFEDSNENVALSYRLGYQHVFSGYLRGEIFTAGMPDKILANSKGLSVKPQLVGFGLHYIFH